MSFDDYPAFCDGFEKVLPVEPTVIIQVKKLEGLEKEGVHADLRGGFELYLMEQLRFETKLGFEILRDGLAHLLL